MQTILEIKDQSFSPENNYSYDGFVITLSDNTSIKLGIENHQSGCENWGYFMTNDNLEDFIGAQFIGVKTVDNCLIKEKCPDMYEGGITYVDIETSKGVLQFTAYNDHNGYYSHDAIVIVGDSKVISESL